jgi:GH15 family glucan-1,4-alpha-glucosidase
LFQEALLPEAARFASGHYPPKLVRKSLDEPFRGETFLRTPSCRYKIYSGNASMRGNKKIQDYGIIGDLHTCALIGKDGSLDWLCFPHIDSPTTFAAILDIKKGGGFSIMPTQEFHSEQTYLNRTNVLQTRFQLTRGRVVLTDFMVPIDEDMREKDIFQGVFRKIEGLKGIVRMRLRFWPRFDYARAHTSFKKIRDGVLALEGKTKLFLTSPENIRFEIKNGEVTSSFSVKEGQVLWFVLGLNREIKIPPEECETKRRQTIKFWREWVHNCEKGKCIFEGRWHDLIVRSSLVLRLLLQPRSNGFCAAPTTSLPEVLGGVRNWDYRFNWVRDTSFIVQAFHSLGYHDEGIQLLKWFKLKFQEAGPEKLRPLYPLHGRAVLREEELKHLSGYMNSRPVRIGNKARRQFQLDIFGEIVQSVYDTTLFGMDLSKKDWDRLRQVIDYVCRNWRKPDLGIWEVRCEPRQFVHSKLMCWVALDRGITIIEKKGLKTPFKYWKEERENIRNAILERGFNKRLNSFVQCFDSEEIDATSLLIPVMGFLPFDDPRVQGTIRVVRQHLGTEGGLLYRYKADDGLPGREGAFLLCSFWLVNVLAASGQRKEAEDCFLDILHHVSPLGLLPEEVDPSTGDFLGNFPQAYSHIGLINSALYLAKAQQKSMKSVRRS